LFQGFISDQKAPELKITSSDSFLHTVSSGAANHENLTGQNLLKEQILQNSFKVFCRDSICRGHARDLWRAWGEFTDLNVRLICLLHENVPGEVGLQPAYHFFCWDEGQTQRLGCKEKPDNGWSVCNNLTPRLVQTSFREL
jgi:hypothetical protein